MDNTKNRLKRLMSLLHITQKELAQKSHIREASISHYVNGRSEPGQKTLKKIADTFNVNPSWLMGYGEDTDLNAFTPDIFSLVEKEEISDFDKMLIAAYHDATDLERETINIMLHLESEE